MKKDPEPNAGPVTPPAAMPNIYHPSLSDLPSAIPKVILRAIAETVLFLSLGCFSALAYTASGTTYTTNGSASDVQAAVNAAPNGSTVIIPNGNYTWSQQVNVNKYLIIRAATVTPSANVGGPPTISPPVVTTPPSVNITHGGASTNLILITDSSAGHTQLEGINFLPGGANNTQSYIEVVGSGGQAVIMNDCQFNVNNFQMFNAVQWFDTGGLIYNCYFTGGVAGCGSGCLRTYSSIPWYNTSTFGALDSSGTQNLYVEQCQFDNIINQAVDADECTRIVVRYCIINNTQFLTHGITSAWGGRQVELYKNTWQYFKAGGTYSGTCPTPPTAWPDLNRYFWCRAGTARVWGNAVQPIYSQGYYSVRTSWSFIDEPVTRPGSGNGDQCETEAQYPGTRWPGTGSNGTSYPSGQIVSPSFVDPIYIWNNTDLPGSVSGAPSGASSSWGTSDQTGYGCNAPGPGNQTSDVFLLNRDIILSAPNNNPSPPYSPYTYPHPFQALAGAGGGGGGGGGGPTPAVTPPAPQNLRVQ